MFHEALTCVGVLTFVNQQVKVVIVIVIITLKPVIHNIKFSPKVIIILVGVCGTKMDMVMIVWLLCHHFEGFHQLMLPCHNKNYSFIIPVYN